MYSSIQFWLGLALLCLSQSTQAQFLQQYFDGGDSIPGYAIFTTIDTSNANNVWQVGPSYKPNFIAVTAPNAMMTDTINSYPINNRSSFSFSVPPDPFGWSILAIVWNQRLDLERGKDVGLVEFSVDSGATWANAFTSPYTYNFYGFNQSNRDTSASGEIGFGGTDNSIYTIWLCFDNNYLITLTGEIQFRFTLVSDSVDTQQYGWLIDDLNAQKTLIHTIKSTEQSTYLKVFPTATTGIVHLEAEKLLEYHIIEWIELRSTDGRLVQSWGISPTKFHIDISNHPNGLYYLSVKTNKKLETVPIVLSR